MWYLLNDDILFKLIENKLKTKVRINQFSSKEFPKFIFICGENILDNCGNLLSSEELVNNKRCHIMDYLNNYRLEDKRTIYCLISEKLTRDNDFIDLLTFEELLTELSDEIILLVESPGTICELGAFSFDENIMRKLFVINNDSHINTNSFINEGPIEKVRKYREDRVAFINYDFNQFKRDFRLKQHLSHICEMEITIKPNLQHKELILKNLIYELLNIIQIFHPLTIEELIGLYKNIKGISGFEILNRNKHKVSGFSNVVDILQRLGLVKVVGRFIVMNDDFTCHNALFKLKKNEMNHIRNIVLSRFYKKCSERIEVLSYEPTNTNEQRFEVR